MRFVRRSVTDRLLIPIVSIDRFGLGWAGLDQCPPQTTDHHDLPTDRRLTWWWSVVQVTDWLTDLLRAVWRSALVWWVSEHDLDAGLYSLWLLHGDKDDCHAMVAGGRWRSCCPMTKRLKMLRVEMMIVIVSRSEIVAGEMEEAVGRFFGSRDRSSIGTFKWRSPEQIKSVHSCLSNQHQLH